MLWVSRTEGALPNSSKSTRGLTPRTRTEDCWDVGGNFARYYYRYFLMYLITMWLIDWFFQRHNWNPDNVKPFLHFRHSPNTKCYIKLEERRKFVQFLARLLPDRTLFSVYTRFKNMFSGHVQHRYAIPQFTERNCSSNYILQFVSGTLTGKT